MGLFDSLKRTVSKLDWWDKEENAQQQRQFREEDERKKREQQILAQQRADAQAKLAQERQVREQQEQQQVQQKTVIDVLQKPQNSLIPTVQTPGDAIRQQLNVPMKPQPNNKQAELNALTEKHMARALEEEKGRTSWFDRQVTDRDWNERARNIARGRAAMEYQDKNGWNNDADVIAFTKGTSARANQLSENSRALGAGIDQFAKDVDWFADKASYVPVTGTVMDWGLRGLENAGPAGLEATARDRHKKLSLGMTQAEYDALDPEMRNKLDVLSGAGTAAGVLDFFGLAGLSKAPIKAAGMKAVKEAIAEKALREATEKALIQAGKTTIKQGAPAALAGGAISAGGQQYLSGEVDAAEAAKTGLLTAGLSFLDPSQGTRNVVKNSITQNALRTADDAGAASSGAIIPNLDAPQADGIPLKPNAVNGVPLEAPQKPKTEVAPGVLKTVDESVAATPPAAVTPPAPTPAPAPLPSPVPPSLSKLPTAGAVPTGQVNTVPLRPQTINTEIMKAPTASVQAATIAPPVAPRVAEAAQLKTASREASEAAPTPPTGAGAVDEATAALTARRDAMLDERASMQAEGISTKELDAQINLLNKQLSGKADEFADPEADRLAGLPAKGEFQAAPTKPGQVTWENPSTGKLETFPNKKALDAFLAKRGEEAQAKIAEKFSGKVNDIDALKEAARNSKSLTEFFEKTKTDLFDENGRMTDPVTGETISRKQFFDDAKATADTSEAPKPDVAQSTATPVEPTLKTQAQKDAHEVARAELVRKAEAETAGAPPKKVEEAPAKTVAPEQTVDAAPSKPAPTKADLLEDVRSHMTKSGKVREAWKNAQRKAGASVEDIRDVVDSVQGKPAPAKVPEVAAGGIAKSGGTAVSKSGDVIEATSKKAAENLGKAEAKKTDAQTFIDQMKAKEANKEGFSQKDAETATELQKSFSPDDKEFHDLGDINRKSGTQAAQTLAVRNKQVRDTGTEEDIVNHFVNRLRNNTGVRITTADLKDIQAKVKREVEARTEFNKAQEAYYKDPSNDDAMKQALDAKASRDAARKEAMVEEMRAAINSKKGTDRKTKQELGKLIDEMQKDADVWQMDYVDASLLSSTGTPIANIINSGVGGIEELMFGKIGAAVSRGLTKTTVSGASVRDIRGSQKFGFRRLGNEWQARKTLPSKNVGGKLLNSAKNVVTTVNELGNTQIEAAAHSATKAEYKSILKAEYPDKYGKGATKEGKAELEKLAEYNATVDPRDIRQKYIDAGFVTQGMGAVLGHAGKSKVATFENNLSKGMSNQLQSFGLNKNVSDVTGKLVTRIVFGFPTIVTRSAEQGARRLTGGLPTFIQAARASDKTEQAMLIKQGVKELGSGGAMVAAGYAMGAEGQITGSYPTDPKEQEAWQKEGKTEHAIKIAGSYYNIPRALGPFAIPFLVGAQVGQNSAEGDGSMVNTAKAVLETMGGTLPLSQISDNLTTINYLFDNSSDATKEKAAEKILGNAARVLIPFSGAFNQIAQSTTEFQKETQGDTMIETVLNKMLAATPVLNKNLEDKTTDDGTLVRNTDPWARFLGAKSTENTGEVKRAMEEDAFNNEKIAPIAGDKAIYDRLPEETQKLLNDALDEKRSSRLTDDNYKKIANEVAKTTNKFAEEGKWDSYGRTLEMKKSLMDKDANATEADKQKVGRQITQASLMDKMDVDPEIYRLYTTTTDEGGISQADFKKMIDPEDEDFTEEGSILAEKLFLLDKYFAENGVSDNTTGTGEPWKKQKYSIPDPKKGRGKGGGSGSSEKAPSTDFGRLGTFAKPENGVGQKYKALTQSGSPMPNLTTQSSATGLKKKISVARGVKL